MKIFRIPVSSSNLVAVGYDPDTETLEVEFKTGTIYRYGGVEKQLWLDLMKAPSIGSFFSLRIRGQFPESKIN